MIKKLIAKGGYNVLKIYLLNYLFSRTKIVITKARVLLCTCTVSSFKSRVTMTIGKHVRRDGRSDRSMNLPVPLYATSIHSGSLTCSIVVL